MLSGRKIPSDGGNAAAISWENKPAILSIINNITLRKRLELNSSKPEIALPGSELTAQCLFKIIPLLEKPISCLSIPLSNLALFLQDLSMI